MIVPIFFYARCDPTFQRKVLDPLEEEIAEIQARPGENHAVEKFDLIKTAVFNNADRYLIPKQYWRYFIPNLSAVREKARKHFYARDSIGEGVATNHPAFYLMNAERYNDYHYQPVLDFPHEYIDWLFVDSTKNVMTRPPPKEVLEKRERMKKLYSEIEAAEEDTETWFNLLLGVNNDKFLRTNVEYRLRGNLFDKQLWKLYIGYLEDVDPKAMLIVYSKYVRFFLDDKEMLQEYQQQVEEYGPVWLFWKNLFDFEKLPQAADSDEASDEDSYSSDEEMEISSEDDNMDVDYTPFNRQICATFYNSVNPQRKLSFLNPTIVYLLEHAPPSTLQKLFKSGKYFFAGKLTPICYRLENTDKTTEFEEECVTLNILDKNLLDNVYVSSVVQVEWRNRSDVTEIFKSYTSSLIPLLFQCDAKYIKLEHQKLSYKDLKFLIGSGNCVELQMGQLWDCEIKDENGEYVDLEKIMKFLPKIKTLELPTVKVNSKTAHALASQKFEGEIEDIEINNIIGKPFDAEEFKKFIAARRAESIQLTFDPSFNADFVATLKNTLDDCRNSGIAAKYFSITIKS